MNKLLKVTLEFEDSIQYLDGEDAQKWLEACNQISCMQFIHGNEFPKFNWNYSKKEKE